MHDIEKLSGKLLRILRAETVDHPMLDRAIEKHRDLIAAINWIAPDLPERAGSDDLANAIEDALGYWGHHLPTHIAARFRETTAYALTKAGIECSRTSCHKF